MVSVYRVRVAARAAGTTTRHAGQHRSQHVVSDCHPGADRPQSFRRTLVTPMSLQLPHQPFGTQLFQVVRRSSYIVRRATRALTCWANWLAVKPPGVAGRLGAAPSLLTHSGGGRRAAAHIAAALATLRKAQSPAAQAPSNSFRLAIQRVHMGGNGCWTGVGEVRRILPGSLKRQPATQHSSLRSPWPACDRTDAPCPPISLVEMRLAEPSWKQRDDGRLEPAWAERGRQNVGRTGTTDFWYLLPSGAHRGYSGIAARLSESHVSPYFPCAM
jgi:hypothetical protein